jgi:hypothetical protein
MNVNLKAPTGFSTATSVVLIDGTLAVVDAFGYVTVDSKYVDALEAQGFVTVLNPNDTLPNDKYTAQTDTTAAAVAAANLVARNAVLNMTGTLTGGAALTLPTVAALAALIPEWAVGMSIRLRVINSGGGAFSWTLTTATTWTMSGTMTVAQNTWRDFLITFQSGVAGTVQSVGTGTNS